MQVGEAVQTHDHVLRVIWAYARKNRLVKQGESALIVACDDTLRGLFGAECEVRLSVLAFGARSAAHQAPYRSSRWTSCLDACGRT